MEKRSREKHLKRFEKMQERLIDLAEDSAAIAQSFGKLVKQSITETYQEKAKAADTIESLSHKRVMTASREAVEHAKAYEQLLSRAMQVDYIVSEMEKHQEDSSNE